MYDFHIFLITPFTVEQTFYDHDVVLTRIPIKTMDKIKYKLINVLY